MRGEGGGCVPRKVPKKVLECEGGTIQGESSPRLFCEGVCGASKEHATVANMEVSRMESPGPRHTHPPRFTPVTGRGGAPP